jgi:DNA/RNA endonuclease G (NUC1)
VQSPPTPAGAVVISQVYGGGGNAGAFYRYDFIELFNRSSQPVNLNGWSVQYASAGGGATAGWNRRTPLTGVIQPGQYFLVREASGNNTSAADLPPADVIGTIAMGATDGKVALVSNNVDLPNGCPVGGTNVIDFVGYGTADCFEGTTAAPQISNTTADSRTHNGCKDTDLNNLNFTEGPPAPRNSSSTLNVCPAGDLAPDVFSTDPANGGTNTPLAANVTVNFDANVNVSDGGFTLSCTLSGPHTLTVTGGPATFSLNPDTDFAEGEQCTATVLASHVTAQNASATPMANDYTWSFGTLIVRDPNEHMVMGNPSGAVTDVNQPLNYLMMKPQYALSYNNDKGTPNWTSWHLDSSWTTNVSDRQNTFRPDDTLPASFKHVQSGYNFATYGFDRGHMTPSADRTSSVEDNSATFLMTNMVPQASGNNQGPWASMENDLRSLLNGSANELYIISGGTGTGGNSTTGHWDTIQDTGGNTVNVPAFTWKVVMVMSRQDGDDVARVNNATRTFAVIMPNNDNIRPDDWRKYLATVDQVEALSGYNFFSNVPESIQNVIEARLDDTLDTTPVANNQSTTTAEDTQKAITLSATDFNVNNVFTYTVGAPSHGVLSGTAPNLTYTPNADYNGSDSFTFKVNDGDRDSNTATVSINVTPVNDAPVAVDDSANTDEDTPVTVSVLANDTDVEGDTLSVASVGTPSHGGAVIVGSDVKYTPNADYNGADSFTYTVSDGHGGTATGTVNVNVAGVNDGPVANDDAATTDEDTAVNVNVVGNDSDLDGDTLSVTAVTQPGHGSATFAGGSVTYTPALNYNGGDSFSYTVGDGHGGTATATVSITVNAVNDNPVAVNDSATVAEDSGANTVNVLTNDTDVDTDTLSVSAVTQGAHGSVTNNGGSVSYTPNTNYNGTDSFSYTVSDGNGGTATATVSVTVNSVNDNPVASADVTLTNEDASVNVNVLANDSDVDGDSLSVTSAGGATQGSVSVSAGGVTYTPNANANGTDSFTYTVSDGHGGTASATVSVTINAVNDAPTLSNVPATATIPELAAYTFTASANDVDGDGLTFSLVGAPAGATINASTGQFNWTPSEAQGGTGSP